MNIEGLRKNYTMSGLSKSEMANDPIDQFRLWFEEMCRVAPEWFEPTAMTLSTASIRGEVSARIVLLKGYDENGFVLYTNYASKKGSQLAENPRAALTMHWPFLERQLRIEGVVEKVSREQSDRYFRSRPRGSQLGAAISAQSLVVANRAELESQLRALESQLDGAEVPLPETWGGYLVVPERIEFWQGRTNRLHDRMLYSRTGGGWQLDRLSP